MSLFGNLFGGEDQSKQRDAARQIQLGDFSISGPDGMSVGFTPTSGSVSLGALDPLRAALLRYSSGTLGADGSSGPLKNAAVDATRALTANRIDPAFIALLSRAAQGQYGSGAIPESLSTSVGSLNGYSGVDPSLLSSMQRAAASRLAVAGANPDDVAAQRLQLMRDQAQPSEQQFVNKQLNDAFARGRFGANDSYSGAVSEGIGRALTGADQQRMLDAIKYARGMQSDAYSQGIGLSSGADTMMGTAFSRALGGAGAGLNLFNAGQGAQSAELQRILSAIGGMTSATGFNNNAATQGYGVARDLFNSTDTAQNSAVQRALGALGGVTGMDSQGMQSFMAALIAANAKRYAAEDQFDAFGKLAKNNMGQKYWNMASGFVDAFMPG